MTDTTALVSFRLDRDRPMRIRWHATDGVPGDGYRAQVTVFRFDDGTALEMDSSAILEHIAPDPAGGIGAYLVTFNGLVGYAAHHPDRARVDKLEQHEVGFELIFLRERDDRVAVQGEDYEVREHPRALAHKIAHHA